MRVWVYLLNWELRALGILFHFGMPEFIIRQFETVIILNALIP
jgi:hypothetical protein